MSCEEFKDITQEEAIDFIKSIHEINLNDWSIYEEFPDRLKKDIEFNLRAIRETELPLSFIKEFQNNKQVVISCINNNPYDLQYASKELRDDKEIVQLSIAISNDALSLRYASEKISDDKDIVLYCVSKNGMSLRYASDRLKNDREVAITAISNNGQSIEYVSSEFQDDEELVIMAVKKSSEALFSVNERLKNDKKIVLIALESHSDSHFYIGDELKKEIGENDPIFYLKTTTLHKELSNEISNSNTNNKAKPKL